MTDKKRPRGNPNWKPGLSGNPRGKPPGNGKVSQIRAAIAERVPELLVAMLDRALAGDVGAARLLLERAVPPLKASEQVQSLTLPDGTLTQQGRAVLACVASGELAPGQGAQLLTAISALARVTEIDELTDRITKLEEKQNAKS